MVLVILAGRIIASILIILVINKALGNLHFDMLTHFLYASPITIESLPPGKVLNRFSTDNGVIDASTWASNSRIYWFNDSLYSNFILGSLYIAFISNLRNYFYLIAYILLLIFIKRV